MFPPGPLGTRADILVDVVMLSFVIILPILIISWRTARVRKDYAVHRKIQITLGVTLAIVVAIFEYDLAMSGGIYELTKGGQYEGTSILTWTINIHTLFAVVTSFIWVGLIVVSMFKFDNPPEPNSFSKMHRFWGITGMITMIGTGVTAPPLYYFGFMA